MEPEAETPFEAIRRLQQQADKLESRIAWIKKGLEERRIRGPLLWHIESKIELLEAERNAVTRNILQLKKINT